MEETPDKSTCNLKGQGDRVKVFKGLLPQETQDDVL